MQSLKAQTTSKFYGMEQEANGHDFYYTDIDDDSMSDLTTPN